MITLTANDNALGEVPESVGALGRLATLELRKNRLRGLPPAVARLTACVTLDLRCVVCVPVCFCASVLLCGFRVGSRLQCSVAQLCAHVSDYVRACVGGCAPVGAHRSVCVGQRE